MTTRRGRTRIAPAALVAFALSATACDREPERLLRVCADPNNLPFSDSAGRGFENGLATLVADELHAKVRYTWWAQRRGFVRNTLNANQCDLVMGVPTSFELTGVTRPYYRSSYVFVTRRDRGLRIRSFEDPQLRTLRVGVQLIGDDGTNAPPAHALARRGIVENVRGYQVQGDYRRTAPPARIIDAVVNGEIDVAIVWGPLAGFFARSDSVPLDLAFVSPQIDLPFLPFVYDISMGMRRADSSFRDTLNAILVRRRESIDSLLDAYGVPRLGLKRTQPTAASVEPAEPAPSESEPR